MDERMYEMFNSLRLELKQDISTMGTSVANQIGKVEQKLDGIEKGREKDNQRINDLRVSVATVNVKIAAVAFIGSTIGGAIVTSIVGSFLA